MNTLGIIPARSGSKGIKDKNIKFLNGKPLLAYTIECALQCKYIDKVMVSTDSHIYADISKEYGAEVPFLRSKDNSSDTASSISVVFEVLEMYEKMGMHFDNTVLLQPTSPLRTSDNLDKAFELFYSKGADGIVSVCECEHSPMLCNVLNADLNMSNFIDRELQCRRQDMKKYYRINGAIYIADVKKLKENCSFYGERTYAYVMEQRNSVDIDAEIDFEYAEFLLTR